MFGGKEKSSVTVDSIQFIEFLEDNASEMWNSDIARSIIQDQYSIGLSANVAAVLGVGTAPINFTLLTRGEAGIYFTPTVSATVGTGIEGNAGITYSSGWFTGNPRDIKASHLQGHAVGISLGIGAGADASVGVSYSPVNHKNLSLGGYITGNVFIGVGIEGSPISGVNIQANYTYTSKAVELYRF